MPTAGPAVGIRDKDKKSRKQVTFGMLPFRPGRLQGVTLVPAAAQQTSATRAALRRVPPILAALEEITPIMGERRRVRGGEAEVLDREEKAGAGKRAAAGNNELLDGNFDGAGMRPESGGSGEGEAKSSGAHSGAMDLEEEGIEDSVDGARGEDLAFTSSPESCMAPALPAASDMDAPPVIGGRWRGRREEADVPRSKLHKIAASDDGSAVLEGGGGSAAGMEVDRLEGGNDPGTGGSRDLDGRSPEAGAASAPTYMASSWNAFSQRIIGGFDADQRALFDVLRRPDDPAPGRQNSQRFLEILEHMKESCQRVLNDRETLAVSHAIKTLGFGDPESFQGFLVGTIAASIARKV
mmetsp:Transcript_28907/g.72599  ORF Transcript_28907/g.72599 Transcript_28907/m.72599 type:complete len:353 (+) Transcript_28907:98-1156(+)